MTANKKQADILEIRDELRKAEYAIDVRRADLAIEIMTRVLAEHPENSIAFYTIGRAYMQKKMYLRALDAFQESLRLNPLYSQAHSLYASALSSTHQYVQAEAEAWIAIEQEPSSDFAHYVFASVLFDQRKNLPLAQKHCFKALELNPEKAGYHWLLGRIFAAQSLFDQAETEFRRALSIEPEHAFTHNSYGVLLLNNKHNPRAAFEHFRIALMQNPNDEGIKKNFFIALKAKHPIYWVFWRYGLLVKSLGVFRFVIPLAVLMFIATLTGLIPDKAIASGLHALLYLLYLLFCICSWIINPMFNFFIKRGWLH
jgi:tetratricopeptide (TPR) repeat protein